MANPRAPFSEISPLRSAIYCRVQVMWAFRFSQHDLMTFNDIHKASGFVITNEPLGFVLTKPVGDFLLRVYNPTINAQWLFPGIMSYALTELYIHMLQSFTFPTIIC